MYYVVRKLAMYLYSAFLYSAVGENLARTERDFQKGPRGGILNVSPATRPGKYSFLNRPHRCFFQNISFSILCCFNKLEAFCGGRGHAYPPLCIGTLTPSFRTFFPSSLSSSDYFH